jgi:hypothetical protein
MKSSNVSKVQKDQDLNVKVESVIKEANSLSAIREKFETEELARTNKSLCAILSRVYELFNEAIAEGCIKESVLRMREVLKNRGVKIQSNTPALTVFVRYIFNSDRKRAYNYTSTLMAAIQSNVKPTDLAAFIESKSGVEECKKEFRKSEESVLKEQALVMASAEVSEYLSTMTAISTVTLASESVTLSDDVKYAFIIARVVGDGQYDLLRVVPRSTNGMFKSSVKELATQLIERKEQAILEAKKERVTTQTQKTVEAMTAKDVASMTLEELEAA